MDLPKYDWQKIYENLFWEAVDSGLSEAVAHAQAKRISAEMMSLYRQQAKEWVLANG